MNDNEILLSIIITTYNNGEFIETCLSKISKQYSDKIEIIIVDDDSNDNTVEICKKHLRLIKNKEIIINKHSGLSVSRNIGVKHAKGTYIAFVDGDDWVDQNYVKNAIKTLEKNKYDVILIDTIKYFQNTKSYCIEKFDFDKLNSFPNDNTSIRLINNNICGRAWRFIVKRSFLEHHNIVFSPNILHEDEEWVTRILNAYNTIYYDNNIKYYYRKHDNSIMSNKTIQNYLDLLYVAKQLFELNQKVNNNYPNYIQYIIFRCIRNSFSNYYKFTTLEQQMLDKWFYKNKRVYKYGVRYKLFANILFCIFGYKKSMEIYRNLIINKNSRVDNYIDEQNDKS